MQGWPLSPASWAADRAWALACGHLLLVFLNCFHLKKQNKKNPAKLKDPYCEEIQARTGED